MALGQEEVTKKAEAFLEEREKREEKEKHLLQVHGGTLVTLRANYPGPDKRQPHTDLVVEILQEEVAKRILVKKMVTHRGLEGLLLHFLTEEEGQKVKRAMVKLEEEHPLGRLVDIDVRDKNKVLSRVDFSQEPRKCYICSAQAQHCVRSVKHSYEEVVCFYKERVRRYVQGAL